MKKILLITLEYSPQKGGVASYYAGLVGELERQGYEVKVITNTRNPSQPPLKVRGGELLGWFWPRWLIGYFTVRKAIKKEKPDIVLAGHILPLGTIAYLLRKQVPYGVFLHGLDLLRPQKSWRKRKLGQKILESAKLIIVNSEYTKALVTNMSDTLKLTIVKNRVPVIVVYPCPNMEAEVKQEEVEALRRKLGLTGKKVLLTLGRVVERKGHDMVLRAMPEILQHVPEVVYVVAGGGPNLGRLQKMVGQPSPQSSPMKGEEGKQLPSPLVGEGSRRPGEGLQPYVRFVGVVPAEERPAYYALCDLFVMPSRQIKTDVEGFGLAFLEAAVFGKPSVGGASGGQGEAILDGKTGALVDPSDPSALARIAVQLLRNDALRAELGQNAKARAMYEFRWEKQIEKFINALSSP